MPRAGEKNRDRICLNAGTVVCVLTVILVSGLAPIAAQTRRGSNQKANQTDRVMVSRTLSKSGEEPQHGRKGKKGFVTTATAKRTEPKAPAPKARTAISNSQPARRTSSRPTTAAKIEPTAVARAESSRTEEPTPPPVLAASDRIEVVEWGAKPTVSVQPAPRPVPTRPGSSSRRYEVDMDPGRIQQIQQALISRGFLTGEPTSFYDDATIEAMRQFQISQKIDATGYPTAHALKRLGL